MIMSYNKTYAKKGRKMADYQKLYHKTFNAVTDAERLLEQASMLLKTVQQECEDLYIENAEASILLICGEGQKTDA